MTGRDDDARRAWHAMSELVLRNDRKEDVAKEIGVSFARVRVLRRLIEEPLTLKALSARLNADPPYVTLMIDNLEDLGLVERKPHPSDRRAKLVELTAPGRAAAQRAEQLLSAPPPEMLNLTRTQLASLADTLNAVAKSPEESQ